MTLAPAVECNEWRPSDGRPAGLDDWRGMHHNWVDVDNSSTLEVGGQASGHFRLAMQGTSSQTIIYIEGDFSVDVIKRERWGNPDLNAELIEESGVEICGGSASAARIRQERAWRAVDLDRTARQ